MNFWGVVSLCLSVLPRCLTVMILGSFQTDRYANSVDPDQTPVLSRFTMFDILSPSFWLIMLKNDPDQEWWLQFFLIFEFEENSRSPVMKKAVFCIFQIKDAVTVKLISAFVSTTRLE